MGRGRIKPGVREYHPQVFRGTFDGIGIEARRYWDCHAAFDESQ
jgi:hypothetical protein